MQDTNDFCKEGDERKNGIYLFGIAPGEWRSKAAYLHLGCSTGVRGKCLIMLMLSSKEMKRHDAV